MRDWLAWRCNFLKGTKPTGSADVKWESPVQIVERPPGCLWYGHASLSVCVFVCVGRGSSNKSAAGFVAPTVAALFLNAGPLSVPSASCNRIGSSSLLSTQLVFARNLFSGAVWMCARLCTLNRESDAYFSPFIRGRKEANDTAHTHTQKHTPLT